MMPFSIRISFSASLFSCSMYFSFARSSSSVRAFILEVRKRILDNYFFRLRRSFRMPSSFFMLSFLMAMILDITSFPILLYTSLSILSDLYFDNFTLYFLAYCFSSSHILDRCSRSSLPFELLARRENEMESACFWMDSGRDA